MELLSSALILISCISIGVCGIYTYDIAETKAIQVTNYARKYEHPLQIQLEKE